MKIANLRFPNGDQIICPRDQLLHGHKYQTLLENHRQELGDCLCRPDKPLKVAVSYDRSNELFYTHALRNERHEHDLARCGGVGDESDSEGGGRSAREEEEALSTAAERAYERAYGTYLEGVAAKDLWGFRRQMWAGFLEAAHDLRCLNFGQEQIRIGLFEDTLCVPEPNAWAVGIPVDEPRPEGLSLAKWRIPLGIPCGGRLDIAGVPILGQTLLLAIARPEPTEPLIMHLHAWPVWWPGDDSHAPVAVHSGAERRCAGIWDRHRLPFLKPPSLSFLSRELTAHLPAPVAIRLVELNLWPDFFVQALGQWVCVEVAGFTTPEYRLRLIEKKILFRETARTLPGFEWLVLGPKDGGFFVQDGTTSAKATGAIMAAVTAP